MRENNRTGNQHSTLLDTIVKAAEASKPTTRSTFSDHVIELINKPARPSLRQIVSEVVKSRGNRSTITKTAQFMPMPGDDMGANDMDAQPPVAEEPMPPTDDISNDTSPAEAEGLSPEQDNGAAHKAMELFIELAGGHEQAKAMLETGGGHDLGMKGDPIANEVPEMEDGTPDFGPDDPELGNMEEPSEMPSPPMM